MVKGLFSWQSCFFFKIYFYPNIKSSTTNKWEVKWWIFYLFIWNTKGRIQFKSNFFDISTNLFFIILDFKESGPFIFVCYSEMKMTKLSILSLVFNYFKRISKGKVKFDFWFLLRFELFILLNTLFWKFICNFLLKRFVYLSYIE